MHGPKIPGRPSFEGRLRRPPQDDGDRVRAKRPVMDAKLPDIAIAETLADRIVAFDAAKLPDAARTKCEETLVDVVGLCLAARNEDYVQAALNGWDEDGPCTAIGHKRALSPA